MMDSHPRHFGAETPENNNAQGNKRRADEGAPIQTRAKRNRYTSIAWYAFLDLIVRLHSIDDTYNQQRMQAAKDQV